MMLSTRNIREDLQTSHSQAQQKSKGYQVGQEEQQHAMWNKNSDDRLPLGRQAFTSQKTAQDKLTQWLGQPPDGHDLFTARVSLEHHKPTSADLDSVRKTFQVFIWWQSEHIIDIAGRVQNDLLAAVATIKKALESVEAEAKLSDKLCLLCQPNNKQDYMNGLIRLTPCQQASTAKNHEPDDTYVYRPVTLNSPKAMARSFRAGSNLTESLNISQKILNQVTQWAGNSLGIRKKIRLRVGFGLATMNGYDNASFNVAEFVDMLDRGDDLSCKFISDFQSVREVQFILEAMRLRRTDFYPLDENYGHQVLILQFPGTRTRIDVDCVGKLEDGTLRFQVAGGAKTCKYPDRCAMNILTFCPDRSSDWQIKASLVVPTTILTPKEMDDLLKSITYVGEEPTDSGSQIPRFRIQEPYISGMTILGDVQQTILETVKRFAYKDTPYIVEVVEQHTWSGIFTREDPKSSCAFHLYADYWDELMGPLADISDVRSWALDVGELFPGSQHESTESKLQNFLRVVQEVRDFLSQGKTDV